MYNEKEKVEQLTKELAKLDKTTVLSYDECLRMIDYAIDDIQVIVDPLIRCVNNNLDALDDGTWDNNEVLADALISINTHLEQIINELKGLTYDLYGDYIYDRNNLKSMVEKQAEMREEA